MANRRMFSLDVVGSDNFLDMPATAQCLYFHLGMRADDEGFISSPKQLIKSIACTNGDLKTLAENGYIIPFNSGIIVIKHWKQNNYLRSDRFKKTRHIQEKSQLLTIDDEYFLSTDGIPNSDTWYTQDSIGKDSIVKDSIVKDSIVKDSIVKDSINTICSEPEESAPNQSGILLPLNDKTFYNVPLDKITMWEETYPAVDVKQELKKMAAWSDANPTKRKTRRGICKFINNWLSKEQDRGSRYQAGSRQQDYKQAKANSFNKFKQNQYDFDEIERHLLGDGKGEGT